MIVYDGKNWLEIIFKLKGSVLQAIWLPTVLASLVGAAAALFHQLDYGLEFPTNGHLFFVIALGLLLVFRTNITYDRYWLGRGLLSSVTVTCNDLNRQMASFSLDSASRAADDVIDCRRLIVVFVEILRHHLRSQTTSMPECIMPSYDTTEEFPGKLRPEEAEELHDVHTPAVTVCYWLSEKIAIARQTGRLTDQRMFQAEESVTELLRLYTLSSVVMQSPLPFPYSQLCKQLLFVYCFTLPFAIVSDAEWLTPVATFLITMALFSLEAIGVELDEPFGTDSNDLPLDAVVDDLKIDTRDLMTNFIARRGFDSVQKTAESGSELRKRVQVQPKG